MSCYFRHISEILKEAGIEVTAENKQEVDRFATIIGESAYLFGGLVHSTMGIEYKNCMPTWREIKRRRGDTAWRANFIKELKGRYSALKQKR